MADNKFTFLGEYKSLKSKEICPLFEDNNVNIWGHCSYSQRLRITCIKDIGLGTPNLGTNKTSFSGRVLTGVDIIRQSFRKSYSKLYFWLWRKDIWQDKRQNQNVLHSIAKISKNLQLWCKILFSEEYLPMSIESQ